MNMGISHLLTVAVITKNEAANIGKCLQSVQDLACPIVLIDSGSEDETVAIAEQYGAKVYSYPDWQGFGVQRNRAVPHIQTPWVLWLDADEQLQETSRQYLLKKLPEIEPDGKTLFAINRLSIAYGGAIRHCGWYPDRVVRLYPVAHCAYNENLVHESVVLPQGAVVEQLEGDVLHHTYRDLTHHMQKMLDYTLPWAVQNQQRKSATLSGAILRSIYAFFKVLVLKRGFADGARGLMIAAMTAIYTFLKYAQLWQLQKVKK